MKKYIIILLTVVLGISFTACEKEIDVDLNSVTPRIVIEGIVKQDQLAKVRVSQTIDFDNNNGYPDLEGAVVKISDDIGNTETLFQDASGWYVASTLKGITGRTYNLYVEYEGKEYTAISKMPPQVALDSLSIYKVPAFDWPFPMVHFKDPVGETNQYYRAVMFINGAQRPNLEEYVYSAEFQDGAIFDQFLMVGKDSDDEDDPFEQGDDVVIEFQCIDKGTYKFFDSINQMGESLTNPETNIKGGALGYFSACTMEQKSIVMRWKE